MKDVQRRRFIRAVNSILEGLDFEELDRSSNVHINYDNVLYKVVRLATACTGMSPEHAAA